MHAVDLVTPPVIVAMVIGLIIFVVVYRMIFKNKR